MPLISDSLPVQLLLPPKVIPVGWLLGRKWKHVGCMSLKQSIHCTTQCLSVCRSSHLCIHLTFPYEVFCCLLLHWSVSLDNLSIAAVRRGPHPFKQLFRVLLYGSIKFYLLIFLLTGIDYLWLCKYVWKTLHGLCSYFLPFSFANSFFCHLVHKQQCVS